MHISIIAVFLALSKDVLKCCFVVVSNNQNSEVAVHSTRFSGNTLPHMNICAGVVITVTFEQVYDAPYAEVRTDGDYEHLQSVNCGCKKCHIYDAAEIVDLFAQPAFLRFQRLLSKK